MKKHQGMSLTGLIVVAFLALMGVIIVAKLFPPYVQYFNIQKTFKNIANNPDSSNATPAEIQGAFWRYADVNYITAISGSDVKVTKIDTQVLLSASYTVKVPLVANISLLLDFNPSSAAQWYELSRRP
jgi:hypothetical protein